MRRGARFLDFYKESKSKKKNSGEGKREREREREEQQLCKIILKSMHKCTSYGPDKLNI